MVDCLERWWWVGVISIFLLLNDSFMLLIERKQKEPIDVDFGYSLLNVFKMCLTVLPIAAFIG